jgi:DNA-binding beta-propeller fold protein YncE
MRHRKVSAALAIVMSVWMWLPAAPECGAQVFLFEWGQAGAGDGQFNEPSGVAIDSAGNVYVADTANHRIQKFDDLGNFLLKWGSSGSGAGQFDAPKGMAVDSADNVYVVDSGNHRIQKFGASGSFVTAWGSSGSGSGQFNQPFGVAVDSLDNVYVTDTGNDRVQKFDRNGVFITSWGSTGQGDGQFQSPRAIAVLITGGDLSDSVYVADANSRIQMFGPGGTYAVEFGGDGQTDGQFNGIDGMGFWEGFLVVADSGNHRVQESWYDGNFIVKWGIFGRDEGRFNRPAGIAGTDGVVYVVDPGNNRIQAFGSPLPPLYYLDLNSLGFILSWAGIQAVESGGLGCALPADTDQNVYWDSTYSLTLSGRSYSGYASGASLVLATTYAANGRIVSEQFDLALQSSSRAVGTVAMVEVDPAGNYCESEGRASLVGTPPVVTPGQPITPVNSGGLIGGGIGGGGGCFITSLR